MARMDPLAATRNGEECYSEHPQRFDGGIGSNTTMAREMMKRITFGHHHRHAGDPGTTALEETSPPAAAGRVLRRGRFAPQSMPDMSSSSSYNPSSYPAAATTSKRRLYHSLMIIAAFGVLSSGVAVAAYSVLGLGGRIFYSFTETTGLARKLRGGPKRGGGFDQIATWMRAETAGMDPEERERRLYVSRSLWPRCVNEKMSAIQCKLLIDEEVLNLNSGYDRFIRTEIVGKRYENDPRSNSVVIILDDDNMVTGKNGDGLVYYDFEWDGSGNEATNQQQRNIPAIIANETTSWSRTTSWEGSSTIERNPVPIRTLGVTTHDAIYHHNEHLTGHRPLISGGVKTTGLEVDTVEGGTKLNTALSESATIEQAGKRTIGPFNCSGMTGHSCCLMIKHKVRDSDKKGRAIQCFMNYHQYTEKRNALISTRGKKVVIYENHNGRITKEPKVVGDWPHGVTDNEADFNQWILEDGSELSDGQWSLIHG